MRTRGEPGEGVPQRELDALGHVALTGVRGEGEIPEVGAAERTADDVAEIEGADQRVVVVAKRQQADVLQPLDGHGATAEPGDIGVEGLDGRRRLDPAAVQPATGQCRGDENRRVGALRTAQIDLRSAEKRR